MGKHAAPRKSLLRSSAAQRAAAVSTGTLVLCLGAAAPALAASAPAPSPTTVSGTDDPIPVPKPVATVVEQVSDATGLPDPISADDGAKTHHHRGPATTKTNVSLRDSQPAPSTQHKQRQTPTALAPTAYPVGGLRAVPGSVLTAIDGRAPNVASTAPTTHIVQSAGSQLLPGLPAMTADQDTARILLVAVAMMLLGGLCSGHIKTAQQRVFGI